MTTQDNSLREELKFEFYAFVKDLPQETQDKFYSRLEAYLDKAITETHEDMIAQNYIATQKVVDKAVVESKKEVVREILGTEAGNDADFVSEMLAVCHKAVEISRELEPELYQNLKESRGK